jgi:uncharacterized membrane protein
LLLLVLPIAFVVAVAWDVGQLIKRSCSHQALRVLRLRLARGEIDTDEYERLRLASRSGSPSPPVKPDGVS